MPKINSLRDPILVRELVAQRPKLPMALGLDLGTNTGMSFCYFDPAKPITPENLAPVYMGQMDLSSEKYESGAIRFVRLRRFLYELNPSVVWYELPRHTTPGGVTKFNVAQIMAREYPTARLLGAFLGVLAEYCENNDIPLEGLEIGQLKKFMTGKGNASKEMMIEAVNEKFGTDLEIDGYESSGADNVADSAAAMLCGLTLNSYGVLPLSR